MTSKHIGSNEERITLKPIECKFECVKNNDIEVVFKDIIGQHMTLIAIQRDELMMQELYKKAPTEHLLKIMSVIEEELKSRDNNDSN